MTVKIALFDFDGTIINNHAQMKFDTGSEFKWDVFANNSMNAPINEQVVEATNILHDAGYSVFICTARPVMIDGLTMDHLESLSDEYGLHYDMVITRSQELQDAELEELDGISDVSLYKDIIHKHHAIYRTLVMEDIHEMYGAEVKYAFDEQELNLNTLVKYGVDGYLIDKAGNLPESPTHTLAGTV